MMTSGDPIPADEALACGLIDEIVDDLEQGAVAFARRAVSEQMSSCESAIETTS